MAFYLVTARPRPERLEALRDRLARGDFRDLRPFGGALTHGLLNARRREDGCVAWEEEDHCSPPLAQERAAVLDDYFDGIEVQAVERGFGWARVRGLPHLFPGLSTDPARESRAPDRTSPST